MTRWSSGSTYGDDVALCTRLSDLGDSTYDATPDGMQLVGILAHRGTMEPKAQKLPKSKSVEVVMNEALYLAFSFLQSIVQICYQNACFYE
jgi:hypothetical protein